MPRKHGSRKAGEIRKKISRQKRIPMGKISLRDVGSRMGVEMPAVRQGVSPGVKVKARPGQDAGQLLHLMKKISRNDRVGKAVRHFSKKGHGK